MSEVIFNDEWENKFMKVQNLNFRYLCEECAGNYDFSIGVSLAKFSMK
jgi:hypothetical protein